MSGPNNPENAKPNAPAAPDAPAPGAASAPEAEPKAADAAAGANDAAAAPDARIFELEAQLSELNDRYLRVHAEMDNVRKRGEREKSDVTKYAIANFARDVLGVSDNLKRAISAVATTDEEHSGALKALVEGVQLTEQELHTALDRHGVRPIPAEGALFDPNVHQAVMEQENKDVPSGSVLQVFQEGYQISERVLRPAMVVVSKGGPKPVKPSADEAAAAPSEATGATADEPRTDTGPEPAAGEGAGASDATGADGTNPDKGQPGAA